MWVNKPFWTQHLYMLCNQHWLTLYFDFKFLKFRMCFGRCIASRMRRSPESLVWRVSAWPFGLQSGCSIRKSTAAHQSTSSMQLKQELRRDLLTNWRRNSPLPSMSNSYKWRSKMGTFQADKWIYWQSDKHKHTRRDSQRNRQQLS